ALAPPLAEVERALVLKAVRAMGITTARWAADYFYLPKTRTARVIDALAAEGQLQRATVEGLDAPAFLHPDNVPLAEAALAGQLVPTTTTLLSPFDPLIWDRARASALFGFDYRIECYTPAPQRRYGYFTLPILWRGALIGRLDPKAHRKEGLFEVKALHLEPEVVVTDELVHDLAATLRACAAWHATPQVHVRLSNPPALAASVNALAA
ncbi:MAG: winged helix DNA-binding domain-containing protein, partial [Anaerolineae bacterium]|nr:winged helix DNA-binding domain-containing protein [Anaerolineae bacterium]